MEFSIRKVDNGYIVVYDDPNGEEKAQKVFEILDPTLGDDAELDRAEAKALEGVLWEIIDVYGNPSRRAAARCRVVIEPGDKFEDGKEQ